MQNSGDIHEQGLPQPDPEHSVLVSFLGRPPVAAGGYRRTTYRFPDGTEEQTSFFGDALRSRLRPQRMVVFGTAGSAWDDLFSNSHEMDADQTKALDDLITAVGQKQAEQHQLDQLAGVLTQRHGCCIHLQIGNYASTLAEQVDHVRMIAEAVADAGAMHLDITHGFRHQPMLVVTALSLLRALRPNLKVAGLWYGAFDPDTGTALVHNLEGLQRMEDWIDALRRFQQSGDYGAFDDLLTDRELAGYLSEAGFHESVHSGQRARSLLRDARQRLKQSPLQGPGALIQPQLEASLAWVENNRLWERQRENAMAALSRDDFLRASLYGFEACVSWLVQDDDAAAGNVNNPREREDLRKSFEDDLSDERLSRDEYFLLKSLRNRLAHGNEPLGNSAGAVNSTIADRETLRSKLDELLVTLLR